MIEKVIEELKNYSLKDLLKLEEAIVSEIALKNPNRDNKWSFKWIIRHPAIQLCESYEFEKDSCLYVLDYAYEYIHREEKTIGLELYVFEKNQFTEGKTFYDFHELNEYLIQLGLPPFNP
ncbi:hypothetical protein [Muninn virus]|nr:hypothetical protein [Muninn virus]